LEAVRTAVNPTSSSDSAMKFPSDNFHTLGLARHIKHLADEIYISTQHTTPPQIANTSVEFLTPAEQLAQKVSFSV
jgi:hypothetical protein